VDKTVWIIEDAPNWSANDNRDGRDLNRPSSIGKERIKIMEIKKLWQWLLNPPLDAPSATILLRMMAGSVFLWEGILKFVYTNQGMGRFTKLGFPFPQATATFDGVLEIVGGLLLITGFLTRLIAIPFVIEMLVAMLSTKIPLYLGTSPLPLPPVPPQTGFWAVLHEVRSEYAQLLTTLFLLIAGPGRWSLDAWLSRKRDVSRQSTPDGVYDLGSLQR
jgi:putative oxidoreductase